MKKRIAIRVSVLAGAVLLATLMVTAGVQAEERLPSGAEVVDRFLKEVGGRAAIQSIDSIHVSGSYELPTYGFKGTITLDFARPESLLFDVDIDSYGQIQRGISDGIVWMSDPQQGTKLLEGAEGEAVRVMALRGFSLLPGNPEIVPSAKVEKVSFDDRPCYKVHMNVKGAAKGYDEFYDVDTGLMIGRIDTIVGPGGSQELKGWASDYKRFGKIMVATSWRHETPGQKWSAHYENVETDKVDMAVFAVPDQVRAQAKK